MTKNKMIFKEEENLKKKDGNDTFRIICQVVRQIC